MAEDIDTSAFLIDPDQLGSLAAAIRWCGERIALELLDHSKEAA